MRDDAWLRERCEALWDAYFSDVPRVNPIVVRFGRRSETRFGSIALRSGISQIQINSLFQLPEAPQIVIDATLVHELAHYVHGYGSAHPRAYPHPHKGGVVEHELARRGCLHLDTEAEVWRKTAWHAFYKEHARDRLESKAVRRNVRNEVWERFLGQAGFRSEPDLQAVLAKVCSAFEADPTSFQVAWLRASLRQKGLSYQTNAPRTILVHGLLASPKAPPEVIQFQIAYWVAASQVGQSWAAISQRMKQAGFENTFGTTIRWRQKAWTQFQNRNHPLRNPPFGG